MKIFDYEEVVMNWDSYTYPIAVGTPVSVDGVLADNSSAHGLIARTVFAKPDGGDTLKIMTGGFIDMEEIVAGYGQELSSAAVQALCGIHFYKEGVCIPTGGSGGGDDSQKWKEETSTQLFSETVTTVTGAMGYNEATLSYTDPITVDTLKVTFNGVEYNCPKITSNIVVAYGGIGETGPDYTEFPFVICSNEEGNFIYTESVGTYTVSGVGDAITYTDAFKDGVIVNARMVVNFTSFGEGAYTADKTTDDIINAFRRRIPIIGYIIRQNNYDGIPFNVERVYTNALTPEISFNAVAVKNNDDIYLYRIVSYSDETGDGYELRELLLKEHQQE